MHALLITMHYSTLYLILLQQSVFLYTFLVFPSQKSACISLFAIVLILLLYKEWLCNWVYYSSAGLGRQWRKWRDCQSFWWTCAWDGTWFSFWTGYIPKGGNGLLCCISLFYKQLIYGLINIEKLFITMANCDSNWNAYNVC